MDADEPTLTPMPNGFCWKPRCHLDTLPTGLFLHGVQVASMQQRIDGSWLARLSPEDGVHAPLLLRPCSSFDAGQRGCELWALRHEQVLRRKVAKKLPWIQNKVVLWGRGRQLDPADVREH
jgi:hypothetical protein